MDTTTTETGEDEPGSCTTADDDPAPAASGPSVDVIIGHRPGSATDAVDAEWLGDRLRAALGLVRPVPAPTKPVALGRVTLSVVDDARMAVLHARHKGQSGPTDVLAFPCDPECDPEDDVERGPPGRVDADVAVNADEAARQAGPRGHSRDQELLLYALHGALHCLGHDDQDPAAARAMHAEEDRILRAIGVGATFAGPDAGGAETDA